MNFSKFLVGPFSLKIYGLGVALAFFIGAFAFYRAIRSEKLSQEFFVHHFWRWVVAGLILGRIFSLFVYLEPHSPYGWVQFFAFWEGEIHWIGVALGFFGFALWDLREHKELPAKWFDQGMLPLLASLMLTDIFAFITGNQYGIETTLPWGVQYETFGVDILSPVHPVTLYAFILHLWFFFFFRRRQNAWKALPGKLFLRTMIALMVINFSLQFLRADHSVLLGEFFHIEQLFVFIFILIFLVLEHRLKRS